MGSFYGGIRMNLIMMVGADDFHLLGPSRNGVIRVSERPRSLEVGPNPQELKHPPHPGHVLARSGPTCKENYRLQARKLRECRNQHPHLLGMMLSSGHLISSWLRSGGEFGGLMRPVE
jgi:hypothetical protein